MDLSSLINKPTPTPSSQPSVMAFEEKAPEHSLLQALTSNSAGEFHNQVKFLEVKPSSMKEEEAYRKIYELNNQKLTLEIK